MKGTTRIFIPIVLCLTQLCYVWDTSSIVQGQKHPKNVLVEVISAENEKINEWINLERNTNTSSGWNVNIKQDISKNISAGNLTIYLLAGGSSDEEMKEISEFRFCDMLGNAAYQTFQMVPDDILNMIIPGHDGNCTISKEVEPMESIGCVSLYWLDSPGIDFPQPPFKMNAEIRFHHDTQYANYKRIRYEDTLFRVHYIVGKNTTSAGEENPCIPKPTPEPTTAPTTMVAPTTTSAPTTTMAPETTSEPTTTPSPTTTIAPETTSPPAKNDKSGYYCLNSNWNYYIIWRICTIAEFIESSIFGIGRLILHIF